MSFIFFYIFMAIGLSMDAFSLAIIYGTNGMNLKKSSILSCVVGVYHFIMPNLSGILGNIFFMNFSRYADIIAGIVFFILALEMLYSFREKESQYHLDSYIEILLFGLAVSIDSFSVGIALSLGGKNLIIAGIVFMIISAIFTFLGLVLGKKLSEKVGTISKIIGIIILFLFSIKYLLGIV